MRQSIRLAKSDVAVVLGCIIFMLANLGAIRGGRERAKRTVCLSNLKQLTAAWNLFADDNGDNLVNGDPGEYGYPNTGMYAPGGEHYREIPWVLPDWRTGMTANQKKQAIIDGALFAYTKTVRLYRCFTGRTSMNEYRLYTVVDAMNCKGWGDGAVMLKKRSEIPEPAKRFVFIDDGGTAGATLGGWTCYVKEDKWWDPPPIRHNFGTNFSFADGHSEYWKWKDPRTIRVEYPFPPTQPGNVDIRRTQLAAWGSAAIR